MQSPQNTGPERPSQGYGPPRYEPPTYGQQPAPYGQQSGYGAYANSPIPSALGGYDGPQVGGTRVLKRIDPGSAFKVGAITYALLWAIIGLPFIFFVSAASAAAPHSSGGLAAVMAGLGFIGYLFFVVIYGLLGGIGAAISAFVYNLVAKWVGGLEIEVS